MFRPFASRARTKLTLVLALFLYTNLFYAYVDVEEIIANIEDQLKSRTISIYPTKFSILNFFTNERTSSLSKYKGEANQQSLSHDVMAVEMIKKLRHSSKPKKLEKSQAVFLTSDVKLSKFNQYEDHHKERSTIGEVILDSLITQILWVNSSKDNNVPIYSMVAAHARSLFVDTKIWRRFYDIMQSMAQKEKKTTEDISLILYNSNLEDFLITIEDPDTIDESFVLEKVELVKKTIEDVKDEASAQVAAAQQVIKVKESQLEDKKSQLEYKDNQVESLSKEIEVHKSQMSIVEKNIVQKSEKQAKWLAFSIYIIILLIPISLGLFIYKIFKYNIFLGVPSIITILGFLGFTFSFKEVYPKLKEWFKTKLIVRKKEALFGENRDNQAAK